MIQGAGLLDGPSWTIGFVGRNDVDERLSRPLLDALL
jgi:hypothetical protein